MMKALVLAVFACGLNAMAQTMPATQPTRTFPETSITDGKVTLRLYLPDGEKGYYRGTRFDPSGMVYAAEYAGHTFLTPWKSRPSPTSHDGVAGTASEFGMDSPLGYDDAVIGDPYYKIGVGILKKTEAAPYRFHAGHVLIERLPWNVRRSDHAIEFEQRLSTESGWGCLYTKKISFLKDAPGFEIVYTLANTGSRHITTDYYCHNFVRIDNDPINENYTLSVPFDAAAGEKASLGAAILEGRTLRFTRPVEKNTFLPLTGFTGASDNDFLIKNKRTGASLRITGDRKPHKIVIYAGAMALCAEPFIELSIPAGACQQFTTRYTFEVP